MERICCVCRKVEQGGQWNKTPVPVGQKVSHVYCPHCYNELLDEIERYAMQRLGKSVYTVLHAGSVRGA